MATYRKFDPRVDALVVETSTVWDPTVEPLNDDDRKWLSQYLHQHPDQASRLAYTRMHTGFAREITVTVDDIARLYRSAGDTSS